jgi:F-type H+-transporting ATPase subunit epsilon
MTMRLRILLPTHVLIDEPAAKVIAEAQNGSFCLLPRHVNFVAALVPGIVAYTSPAGDERFVAVDEGVLVKRNRDVLVSVVNAMAGKSLDALRAGVDEQFRALGEEDQLARAALARLEAGALRRLFELERELHG